MLRAYIGKEVSILANKRETREKQQYLSNQLAIRTLAYFH
jgi:hypothetical protein